MRSLLKISVVACLAGILPGAASAAPSPAIQAKIEAAVTAAMKEFQIPGAALAIDTGGTRWVKTFGYGNASTKRPVAAGDYFAIRSITKSFVVTELMLQIAESHGNMSLDDPVGKYLAGIPNGNIIKLRQLANMTSGLYDYSADPAFLAAFAKDPARGWTVEQLLNFAFHGKGHSAINFRPGTRYQYSNTNTLLIGKVLASVTGKEVAATLTADILHPVDLDRTVYLKGVGLPLPRALGYQGFDNGQPEEILFNASALGAAGAMAATVGDLADWGKVLVNGDLLPLQLQQQRFVAHATAGDPNSPVYDRYGLGMGMIAGWWGHTGSGLGYEAAVLCSIAKNENFAIVVNATNTHDAPARIFCRVLHIMHPGEKLAAKSICDKIP